MTTSFYFPQSKDTAERHNMHYLMPTKHYCSSSERDGEIRLEGHLDNPFLKGFKSDKGYRSRDAVQKLPMSRMKD